MRRHLLTPTLAGLIGALFLVSDASACCHKRKCAQPCAPVATCAPAPAPAPPPPPPPPPEPAPCKPKRCCGLFGGHKLFGCCHKRKCAPPPVTVCEVPPACPAPIPCAPTYYAAPTYQAIPSGQAGPSGQGS
jgi:hypothetical protein